jgi:uncharacterized protein YjbJ (UPF0337 family)
MEESKKEQAQGNWNQLKGSVKEKYGDVFNDEEMQAEGSVNQLIGKIQEKTGETKDHIKNFIDSL